MVSDQPLAARLDSHRTSVNGDFSVSTSPTICFNRSAVDGNVAIPDRIQFYLLKKLLFTRSDFNWYFVRSTFSLTKDVVLKSCNWQMLIVYAQFSDTQNR